MLLYELHDPRQKMIDAALAAMHRLVTSKGDRQSIGGYAFTISKSFNGVNPRELERLYKEKYDVNEVTISENVSALATELEKKYNLKSLFLSDMASRNAFELSSIIVNKDEQGAGTGSKVMQELIAYADANEKIIVLDPGLLDKRHGTTSQSRLRKFYKKFGFIDNKGRNKNYEFRNLMIRYPQTNEAVNEVSREEFDAIQNGYVDTEFDKKWWPLDDDYPLIKHIGKAIGATSWTSWGKVGVPWSTTEMIGGSGTYMLKGDFGHVLLDATKSFRPEQILMAQISTSNRGGGVGVKVMNAIKSYADQKGLPLTIYKVTNKKFFDKFEWLTKTSNDTYEYNSSTVEEGSVNEGYKLQLERDADMMVLNITDTATGKRTEVRGKAGYETNGYDKNDKLHQLLNKIGKTANVSELINGEVVTINPNHPQSNTAKAATHTAFNESLDNPYPFKLTGPSDSQGFVATAQTPNGVLRMDFETTDYDNFGIDFAVGKSMGKTEAGDEFRVFATVVAMMTEWIKTVGIEHVESFDFGANKAEHASDGRAKLYARFAKQLAGQLGWKLEQSTTADRSTAFFKLTNPNPLPRDDEYWDALEENFADGKNQIKEALDNPYPIDWNLKKNNEWYGLAKDGEFHIQIKEFSPGYWSVLFRVGGSLEKTNAGDQFRIFATAKQGIAEWWKSKKTDVDGILFSADKILDNSRATLYNRLAKQFATAIGYELEVSKGTKADIYNLKKPGLEENFADGKVKGKSRPGRVKRSGASCNGSVTELRKKAKNASGEKAKMYHWCANMKSGKK